MLDDLKNLPKVLQNAKMRTIIVVGGVILLIGAIIVLTNLGKDKKAVNPQAASTVAKVPTTIQSVPGGDVPESYRQLQKEVNQTRADEAKKNSASAIPTIIGNSQNPLTKDLNSIFKPKKTPQEAAQEAAAISQKRIDEQRANLEKIKQERLAQQTKEFERIQQVKDKQAYNQDIQQLSQAMGGQAKAIFDVWGKTHTLAYTSGKLANDDASNFANKDVVAQYWGSIDGLSNDSQDNGYDANKNNGKEILKAGSVMFGVLRTAINTDEPGPVLADIVSGKYNGAKLIGAVTAGGSNAQKVTINFTLMTLPSMSTSIAVNVVAIDPDTARTALASSVDNHYLLRYGSLFASSFMEGVGKAIGSQNTITTNSPTATATLQTLAAGQAGSATTATITPQLTTQQQVMVGLGEVGKKWGEQAKSGFSTAPTIMVDPGTSLGLLFLTDTDLTKKQ